MSHYYFVKTLETLEIPDNWGGVLLISLAAFSVIAVAILYLTRDR